MPYVGRGEGGREGGREEGREGERERLPTCCNHRVMRFVYTYAAVFCMYELTVVYDKKIVNVCV
jgi:hypothetical protein